MEHPAFQAEIKLSRGLKE